MAGREIVPQALEGELMPPTPPPPDVQSHKADDIWRMDELVENLRHIEDLYRTVPINPQEDAIRILPDIYNADGSLNETALDERNRRLKARREQQRIKSEFDDFLWRKGLPLLAFLSIGIAVLTRFI